MILTFNPKRQIPPRKGNYCLNGIELSPGLNEVPDEIASHPSFAHLVGLGAIAVQLPEKNEQPLPSKRKSKIKNDGNDEP